jgi:hypothetical protein
MTRTFSFDGLAFLAFFFSPCGAAQYVWHPAGLKSYADPDGTPLHSTLNATPASQFLLPKASLTVLLGPLADN